MSSGHLDLNLEIGEFNVSTRLMLSVVEDWFSWLTERNAKARARDDGYVIRVRVQCPSCSAPIFSLTSVDRGGEVVRACRKCRAEFTRDV